MKRIALACLMMAFLMPVRPRAEALTTGADFLLVNTGARPVALGGAFSAVADDVNTFTYNPAGLGNIRLPEVGYGRYEFVSGLHFDFVGLASPLGSFGVLGAGYLDLGVQPFNSTLDPAAVKGTDDERAFMLGWGKSFGSLHIGLAGKYINRNVGTVTGTGILGDIGFRYRIDPRLTVAASLLNAGPDIKMAVAEPPPTISRTGVAWRAVESYPHTLDLAMDADYPISSQRPIYGWGAEYWYQERYALRAGWVGNSEEEGITAGVGLKLSFLQIDYAFQPYATLGPTHRVSGIFRWDGPWVKGGEPNQARYVTARNVAKGLEIRWEKPMGPVEAFDVTLRPLDGGESRVFSRVPGSPLVVDGTKEGVLYSISIRSIGPGGGISYPTRPLYVEREGDGKSAPAYAEGRPSVEEGVSGTDVASGLLLSWPEAQAATGYHVYLKSPNGTVKRLTEEARKDHRILLPSPQGWEGSSFEVTALQADGTEARVGTFRWYPTREELRSLAAASTLRLKATPQGDGRVFVDWDSDPGATGYTLLYSVGEDGVYQFFGEMPKDRSWVLLRPLRKDATYRFMVVSKDAAGNYLHSSQEAKGAELTRLLDKPPVDDQK